MVEDRRASVRFGTIVARNYLPYARVLAASLARHHPGVRLACLVIDDLERTWQGPIDGASGGVIDLVHLADVIREPLELERMAMCYDVMELATAVKPWWLAHLLEDGGPAVYLDPDTDCHAPLDGLADLAVREGIVLTPHTTEPVPRDGRKPSEADLMETGTYNLGFIAVSAAAAPFLAWWQERLRRDAIVDPKGMLFTDQRWVDLVPGYFDVHILRDPGCNVAYWNLGTRTVEAVPGGGGYTVNGRPLRFLHFSGYDPDRPHLLSRHQGDRPRVLLSERPLVRRLCDDYRRRLLLAGWGDPDLPAYGYGRIPGGPRIDRLMRRVYRQALLAHETEGRPEPPNPFCPGEAPAFLAWLLEPVGGPGSRLTRYLDHLYHARQDLQVAFNGVPGPGTEWYLDWARDHGVKEEGLPVELIPPPREPVPDDVDRDPRRLRAEPRAALRPGTDALNLWRELAPAGRRPRAARRRPPLDVGGGASGPEADEGRAGLPGWGGVTALAASPRLPEGVNVAGYLEAELGLGTAARGVLRAIERTGSPVATVVYRDTQSRQARPFAPLVEGEFPYDISLVCINGDLIGNFARDAGQAFFEDRYTIAQWHWETDTFPDSMRSGLRWVDEVWVASRFEQAAIQRETQRPVVVFPMPVVHDEAVEPVALPREALGLPAGFVFLFCFDFLSIMERKNPVGLVEAFTRAFPPGSGVALVIKSINGERRPAERERLRLAAGAHPDILLLESYLSGAEVQALTAACDAYVSLHRSEGFGLTLADAMAAGKPVIATRYSGNLEFMSDETGYLVDCALVPVGDAGAPYPPSHRWADPDLDHAARLMRQVVADPDGARGRAARGQAALRARFSTQACAAFAAERLAGIRAGRAVAPPAAGPSWLEADGTRAEPLELDDRGPDDVAPDGGRAAAVAAEPAEVERAEAEPAALPRAGADAGAVAGDAAAEPAAVHLIEAAAESGPASAPAPTAPDSAAEPQAEPAALAAPEAEVEAAPLAPPETEAEPPLEAPTPAEPSPAVPTLAEPGAAREPSTVPPLPVTDATARLVAERAAEAVPPLPTGVRGWVAGRVRHRVDRLLAPYDRRQRAIAEALLASIREVAGTVPAAADLLHHRVDGAEARRSALGDRTEALTGHVDRLTRHVGALDHTLAALQETIGRVDGEVGAAHGRMGALEGRIDGVEGRIDGVGGRVDVVSTGLATMTQHLDRLTRHVQGLTVLVDRLNGSAEGLDARQQRILLRHDRLAGRVDRLDDLVTHLERVERELVRARRAAERLVAAAEDGAPALALPLAPRSAAARRRSRARIPTGDGPNAG